jgi:Cellulase (glycosyl hydrolase family 5)
VSRSTRHRPHRGRKAIALVGCILAASAAIGGSQGPPPEGSSNGSTPVARGGAEASTGTPARRPFPTVLHSTPTAAFVDPSGEPLLLEGLNLMPIWSNDPGRTWPAGTYRRIRQAGFTVVRFVLYWDDFEPNRGDWNQVHLSTLDTAVRRAKAAGLYVILDEIHLVGPGGFDHVPPWARTGDSVITVERNGGAYLRMLASRYRAERAVAAYDPVNEFRRWPIDQNGVLRAYDHLIRQIRSVDPERIILVEPSYGDTSVAGGLAEFSNLTNRRNIVWSIHDYFAGGDDDGYGADGRQVGRYTWNGTSGYQVPDLSALERHLLVHLEKARSARLPVWIGEFGIGEGAVNRDRWIDDQVRLFDKYGLGRAWWEYDGAGRFSATNRDGSWKPWVRRLVGTQRRIG